MPYYRCPQCTVTVHSVGGRFTKSSCPTCGERLTESDRIQIQEPHVAAIRRRFRAEYGAAADARRELKTLLGNLDSKELDTISLLVTELIANSVKHSGAPASSGISLDVKLTEDLVRVEVRDGGRGFMPALRNGDSPLESHWGLQLMDELSDRWRVEADPHTCVWFELDRVPVAAPMVYATGRSSSEYGIEDRVRTPNSSTA
jgi:anti-sigma regulatory factor (Ser/Thr protein kinase)